MCMYLYQNVCVRSRASTMQIAVEYFRFIPLIDKTLCALVVVTAVLYYRINATHTYTYVYIKAYLLLSVYLNILIKFKCKMCARSNITNRLKHCTSTFEIFMRQKDIRIFVFSQSLVDSFFTLSFSLSRIYVFVVCRSLQLLILFRF